MDFITWKFLHIATLFFGVALALSGEIAVRRVAGSGDVRAIRTVVERVRPIAGPLATVLFIVGVGFGFLAALAGEIDLLRPWLILAYVAFGSAMIIGITVIDPWVDRLARSAAASPDDAPSDELRRVIDDRVALAGTGALMMLIVALVFIMVVKPLG